MKIRSITCFLNPLEDGVIQRAGNFLREARPRFEEAGYEVQTARIATPPFPQLMEDGSALALVSLAQRWEEEADKAGFAYISLGPALPNRIEDYDRIPAALDATENAFFSGFLTQLGSPRTVSLPAVRACARVIHAAAAITLDGFTNLRFAALANTPSGSPFFPAAYHSLGASPAFAISTEAADLAVQAFELAGSLEEARSRLIEAVERNAHILEETVNGLEQFGVSFHGIDFSLAPFPDRALSLGNAMELLGAPAVGQHGSLAASALIAEAVDRAEFRRVGFSGLMLPLLEDATLAKRAAEGLLSLKDLLLYSAVCGTGLDTVPLPGDASAEQIAAVLLDLAVLASRLDKPLTARLMPVPGKSAGEPTGFDFAFFANSKVMALDAAPLGRFFAGDEAFTLQSRGQT